MEKSIIILVTSSGMGHTDEEPLKEKLTQTFFSLIHKIHPLSKAICFYTDGVKLVCEGSPFLDMLKFLEDKGVRIILCQTCLAYFKLLEKVCVGIVGGMADIMTAMWDADLVITI
jgi:hypothetical protein